MKWKRAIGHLFGLVVVVLYIAFLNDCSHYREWGQKKEVKENIINYE